MMKEKIKTKSKPKKSKKKANEYIPIYEQPAISKPSQTSLSEELQRSKRRPRREVDFLKENAQWFLKQRK